MTDPATFSDYLYKGLGRARLVLVAEDPEPHRAALLDACLHNAIYDRQCTGARTFYYVELMQLFPDPEWFEARILDALASDDDDMDWNQLIEFALLFARRGNPRARQLLYERVGEFALEGETLGAAELVALDGLEGFLFVAQRLGEAAVRDPEFWDGGFLLRDLEALVPPEERAPAFERARAEQPFVGAYLDAVERNAERRKTDSADRFLDQTYLQLKARLAAGEKLSLLRLQRWGEQAPEHELMRAADDVPQRADPEQLSTTLAIFRRRPFPRDHRLLFPLVRNPSEMVRRRALMALELIRHPDVRALALELIERRVEVAGAVSLLGLNYAPGDERWLLDLVRATDDADELHGIGQALRDVFAERPVPEAAPIFLELYERGPCQLCRTDFVDRLIELAAVPGWLIAEAAYDADEDTRQAIADYTAAKE